MPYCWFSPNGGAAAALADAITNAMDHVHMIAYEYQRCDIHTAMLAACASGCEVRLILDRHQQYLETPRITELRAAGAEVLFDKHERHIKSSYVVIDLTMTWTGSYQYTLLDEDHYASDLMRIDGDPGATEHESDFAYHWAHSVFQ